MSSNHTRVHVGGDVFNLKSDAAGAVDADVYYVEHQPDNATVTNIFQQNIYVDYTIDKEQDKITALMLNLQLINNSANPISIVPAHLLIDHYQVFIGKEMADEVTGWNAFLDTITLLNDDVKVQYTGMEAGFDGVTFAPTDTIQPGATLRRYIPLPCLINTIRPMYAAWPDGTYIRIRVYFQNGVQLYTGQYTTGLGVASTAIRTIGFVCGNSDIARDKISLSTAGDLSYRFLQHRQGTLSPPSMTAGVQYRNQINNANGDIAFMHTTLRAANPQGVAITTPIAWASHQLETTAQNNVLGISQVESTFSLHILSPRWVPDCFAYQKLFLYLDSWVPNIKAVFDSGLRLGGNNSFAGRHFLNIIPAATGQYVIDNMSMCYAILRIGSDGTVSINTMLN